MNQGKNTQTCEQTRKSGHDCFRWLKRERKKKENTLALSSQFIEQVVRDISAINCSATTNP